MLSKYKQNVEKEFALVYFNSTIKTEISCRDSLDRSFQKNFNRIDNWISESSGSVIKLVVVENVSISIYSPLSGSSSVEFPDRLTS